MGKILVTGATSTVGSLLVRELSRRGEEVRAVSRSIEELEKMRDLGVELLCGDLSIRADVDEALRGVDRVFLITPFVADFAAQVRTVVEAATEARIEHIVRLSVVGASPDADFEIARQHGRCDALVAASGVGWTVLQPNFFQDDLIEIHVGPIRSKSAFYGASGQGETAYVSAADVVASAAEILAEPSRHSGKTYVLTGPEALSDGKVAEVVSRALGRQVRYVDLSPQELSAGLRNSGAPAWVVDAIVGLEAVKSNGWAGRVSPAVEEITGRPGERYEEFVQRNRQALV